MMEWQGDHPFFLVIRPNDESGNVWIDLDEQGWLTRYAGLMRTPGQWYLVHKQSGQRFFGMVVHEGDQPYYNGKTVGLTGSGGGNKISAYGIGKKLPDGTVQRFWVFANGMVCIGDDIEELAVLLVREMGPLPSG